MLSIAHLRLNPRLVVLDKDGTLLAFDVLWHAWFRRLLEAIEARAPLSEAARAGLAETLGCDLTTDVWDPMGPLTLASVGEVELLAASQLYRYAGRTWPAALEAVAEAKREASEVLSEEDLLRPIGEVAAFLRRLRAESLLLALATTDDREATERHLERMGVRELLATIVCGDDGVPLKPAPGMALEICRRLGVAPAEAIMVGDTVADLLMARQAGYLAAVGVTSGAMPAEMLAPYADAVLPDIHAIRIIPAPQEGA